MKHLKPYILAIVAMGMFMSAKNAETNTFKFNEEGLLGEWKLELYQETGSVTVKDVPVGKYTTETFNSIGMMEFTSSGSVNHNFGYNSKTKVKVDGNVTEEIGFTEAERFEGQFRFQATDSFLMIQTGGQFDDVYKITSLSPHKMLLTSQSSSHADPRKANAESIRITLSR